MKNLLSYLLLAILLFTSNLIAQENYTVNNEQLSLKTEVEITPFVHLGRFSTEKFPTKVLNPEESVKYWFPLIYSRGFKKRLETDRAFFDEICKDMNFSYQLVDPPLYKDYINQNEALRNFDVRDSIKDIIQPTLILSGSKDRMLMPGELQSMQEKIPHSKMEIIPGAGHAFNIESPEETNRIIWKFVQEHLS